MTKAPKRLSEQPVRRVKDSTSERRTSEGNKLPHGPEDLSDSSGSVSVSSGSLSGSSRSGGVSSDSTAETTHPINNVERYNSEKESSPLEIAKRSSTLPERKSRSKLGGHRPTNERRPSSEINSVSKDSFSHVQTNSGSDDESSSESSSSSTDESISSSSSASSSGSLCQIEPEKNAKSVS